MRLLLIFLLLLAVASSTVSLTSGEVLVYELTVSHGNELITYNYTFVINSVNNGIVNFTMIVTNLDNGTTSSQTYIFPLTDLHYLPYNGTLVDSSLKFVGYQEYKGENASVYAGYFLFNGLKIPVEAYYVNGFLKFMNGSYNGYQIEMSLVSQYVKTSVQYPSNGYIIIVAVVVLFIVIGVVLLIKIGKI